jgi:3-oxoacyl-[acyl-carrier-protein] synthase-3
MQCRLDDVAIVGMAAAVPQNVIVNSGDKKLLDTIGVYEKRQSNVKASDMCIAAARQLLNDMGWQPESVTHLVFITQTPDYKVPATSCRIIKELGIGEHCIGVDINIGCSSFAYGLYVLGSMVGTGGRGLLLMGDTNVRCCAPGDTATEPLFGDAGTATALDWRYRDTMYFELGSRFDEAIKMTGDYMSLDGMKVFLFGTKQAPESVRNLMDYAGLKEADVDFFTFHQANRFMNERIRKALDLPESKVPYSIDRYGNTSCASIPLTIVSELGEFLHNGLFRHVACGFGAGLSWGAVYFKTNKIVCSKLVITE